MVSTTGTAHAAAVREIQELLYSNADRFVEADHASGAVRVRFTALAGLVADLVTGPRAERAALWELVKRSVRTGIDLAGQNTAAHVAWFDLHTDLTQLRAGLCAVLDHDPDPQAYPGDERVLADLRELAGENRLRENEVIALGVEVEKLERALTEARAGQPDCRPVRRHDDQRGCAMTAPSTLREIGELIRSCPAALDASPDQVAAWYERKSEMLGHIADETGDPDAARCSRRAHVHAMELLALNAAIAGLPGQGKAAPVARLVTTQGGGV